MRIRKLKLMILVAALLSLANTKNTCAQNLHASTTSKYLFVFNGDGLILWKRPLPKSGMGGYTWNNSFLVIKHSKLIHVYRTPNGNLVCTKHFSHPVEGVAVEADTILVKSGGRISFVSAKSCEIFFEKKLEKGHYSNRVLSYLNNFISLDSRPPRKKIFLVTTSKYILGVTPDAKRLWRFPSSGYRYLGTSFDLFFLSSKDSLKIVNKNTGHAIWKRGYPQKIKWVVIGRRTEVQLENGDVYLYESKTGQLLKKKLARK